MEPLVTIAIPAYRARYFREALASAVAQTWRHREIIVSQDGNDPEIPRICAEFPEVQLVPGPNVRMRHNFERCLQVGSGTYVKMLLDDDWLDPDCVRQMVTVFEEQRGYDITLVASRRWLIDETGRRFNTLGGVPGATRNAVVPKGVMWRLVVRRLHNFIGEMTTVMIRRADLAQFGPEPFSRLGPGAYGQRDLRLFLALNLSGAVYVYHAPLSAFRIHAEQSSFAIETSEQAARRLASWLDLVETAVAGKLIEEDLYRHGLKQVEQLRLRMIDRVPTHRDALAGIMLRVQELQAMAERRRNQGGDVPAVGADLSSTAVRRPEGQD